MYLLILKRKNYLVFIIIKAKFKNFLKSTHLKKENNSNLPYVN